VGARRRRPARRRRRGADQVIRLATDMALGIEANRVRARHLLSPGERRTARSRGPRSWPPGGRRGRLGARRRDDALLALVALRARLPDHAGAMRSSARRWRSRASPTCRPARRWPR
jgi:hypothetical protein